METSESLATESFSYSWLLNVKPALDGLDHEPLIASLEDSSNHEPTFKQMNYNTVNSNIFYEDDQAQNFNFDTAILQSPVALVHADELFSNGLIKPAGYVDPSTIKANPIPASSLPVSSLSSRIASPTTSTIHCSFFRKWQKPSKRIMQKCFRLLIPLCQKIGGSRKSTRVGDINRRSWEVRSWSKSSPQASPQINTAYSSMGDWSYECESSIQEAVLHCKRSIEK